MLKSVDNLSTPCLEGKKALIEIEKTRHFQGEWLVSGKVVLPLLEPKMNSEHLEAGIKLSFPFVDARNEENALHQAVQQMRTLAKTLTDLASAFEQEAPRSASHPGGPSGSPTR